MGKESKAQRRQRVRDWVEIADARAEAYLRLRRTLDFGGRRALKQEQKQKIRAWREEVSELSKPERQDHKKAFKAYRRRLTRARRWTFKGIALLLVLALIAGVSPVVKMFSDMYASQKYNTYGAPVDAARMEGNELSAEICDEGFVLLKNDDSFLPLEKGTGICVFGDDAYHFVYGGSGSAGADQSGAVGIHEAMEKAGLRYDRDLDAAYRELGIADTGADSSIKAMLVNYFTGEVPDTDWHLLPEETVSAARQFSDTAMIVLSSMEVEGSELELSVLQPAKGGSNRAEMIRQVCGTFDHVIIVVNSGNVMELGFLEEYESVDAAVWVGSPGSFGCIELMKVLTGEVNPSGRTVDTWPVSIEQEPSYITYGDHLYTNLDTPLHFFTYNEGIYVGYRYYETWFGADEAAYRENVVFPFGYGLSYTTFTQELTNVVSSAKSITLTVTVTNTGERSGKDVVQAYYSAPWIPGSGMEKPAIALAGFAKTVELEPGDSQELELTFQVRDMASYNKFDSCYELEAGKYRIAIGTNVHDALQNENFFDYEVKKSIQYTTDARTGTEIRSLFDFAQGSTEGVTYLSRLDRKGTFPTEDVRTEASSTFAAQLAGYERYPSRYDVANLSEPAYGQDSGLTLSDLRGASYHDPLWEQFLDQFTVQELIAMQANGGWHTTAIPRLGIPGTTLLDGPSGINSMMTQLDAVAYPMEAVVGSTWNTELAYALGNAIGAEANAYGVHSWYAPAMNIHRIAVGGRNNEYYSEDPLLSGTMAAATIQAVQSRGVAAVMKHFVCNDVELNARSNVTVWVDQQALREIYLKPFEIAVKEGGAMGAMSSFSRLGAKWCGGSSELLKDLLREEWGFTGFVTTDACLGSWMNAEAAAKNGNDLMLEMGMQASVLKLWAAYRRDPIGLSWSLRDCAHNVCYVIVNQIMD